ncbi:hypothetical protein APV28_4770 [Comamonas testosteroni]|nr:hypothetical protein APV28_4770 [Comamonas testosteroni]
MLGDALVIAVDLAAAGIQSAANGHACGADGEAAAGRLVAAGVAAAVLQAFDMEIAPHIGHHLLAADHGPLEVGVATGLERDAVACGYVGVGVGEVVTGLVATAFAGTDGNAGLLPHAHADAAGAGGAAAAEAGRILSRLQTDIAFCGQGGVLAGSNIRAANQDGAVRPRPLGNDVDIAAGLDGAATCAVAGLCRVALAFAGAQADGDGGSLGGIAAAQRLGSALQLAHGVLDVQRRRRSSQGLHAAAAGVAGSIRHVVGCLYGADDRTADADAQAALLEALLGGGAAGFAGLDDLHLFGHDVDITARGHDIAADLLVSIARNDVDIAAHAANRRCSGRGVSARLIGTLHAAADGEADASAAAKDAALGFLAVVLFAGGFLGGGDGDVSACLQGGSRV